jgi:hypothetical protein
MKLHLPVFLRSNSNTFRHSVIPRHISSPANIVPLSGQTRADSSKDRGTEAQKIPVRCCEFENKFCFLTGNSHQDRTCPNCSTLLESALVCQDKKAMLAGEEICHSVTGCLEALLSDWRRRGSASSWPFTTQPLHLSEPFELHSPYRWNGPWLSQRGLAHHSLIPVIIPMRRMAGLSTNPHCSRIHSPDAHYPSLRRFPDPPTRGGRDLPRL